MRRRGGWEPLAACTAGRTDECNQEAGMTQRSRRLSQVVDLGLQGNRTCKELQPGKWCDWSCHHGDRFKVFCSRPKTTVADGQTQNIGSQWGEKKELQKFLSDQIRRC